MRVFFLAEKMCALTVGGVYLGLVDGFERAAEIAPSDAVFCELNPIGEFSPVRFRLDEEFLLHPPRQIELYFGENGVAVYASGFLRADQSMRVIRQERLGSSLLTLAAQGALQLHLENETGYHLVTLNDALEDCAFETFGNGYLLSGSAAFCALSHTGEIVLFSEGRVLSADETLRAEVPFHDSLGHSAVCEWKDGKLVSCSVRAAREPTDATFALALFESALIGADCTPYLSPALAAKAGALKEYLGDFRSVVLTGEKDVVGLVFPRAERVYDVRRFRVTTENGKISNILPL